MSRNRSANHARFSFDMSDNQQKHDEKKVTAATTDAPQEEFISQKNVPSRSEPPPKDAGDPEE